MKVLVTGATGFIGREIVSEMLLNKHLVIGAGRCGKGRTLENQDAEFVCADITNKDGFSDLMKLEKVDLVIHSAGLAHQFGNTKREEFEAVNIKGTENVLKLAADLGAEHFILIGSTAVYGIVGGASGADEHPVIIDENTPLNPETLYAESKLESENICRDFCEKHDMALTIFRLAPVIGEGNVGNVARLIGAIDKNRFVWIGNGNNLKTLIYKRDVARACAIVAEKKSAATEIFNLAGEPVKMKEFVNEISVQLEKKTFPFTIPANLLRLVFRFNRKFTRVRKVEKISETVEKWLSDDCYSAKKIAEKYQFKPETSIYEAVTRQIEFYKKNGR